MGWNWPIRGFDAFERIRIIAGWLGYSGVLSVILGTVWAWLCGIPLIWWPFFGLLALGLLIHLKAALIQLETKRMARAQEAIAATLAPALVEAIKVVVTKQHAAPNHYTIEGETGIFTATIGSAAPRLGPAPFVSLRDAMVQAYDKTKDGVLGPFAQGTSDNPDEALSWLAHFSVKHLPIYGKRPPGTALDRIPEREIKRMHFVGAVEALEGIYDTKPTYTDLSVRPEELAIYLERLAEIDAQFAFELGFEEEAARAQS